MTISCVNPGVASVSARHLMFFTVTIGNGAIVGAASVITRDVQTIALVGPTGAGKSTLINLLTRFYEYDSGVISIDGHPVHTLNKRFLRSSIG